MKKIIFICVISLFSVVAFSTQIFAAGKPCADLDGECKDMVIGGGTTCPNGGINDGVCGGTQLCCKKATTTTTSDTESKSKGFGFDTVDKVANDSGYNSGTEVGLEKRISNIIGIFLSLLGVLFMILMIYGGYNWMTAAGDEQKIDKAKDTIRAAVIGLIIVIAAYAVSIFIITRLWGVGTTTTANIPK